MCLTLLIIVRHIYADGRNWYGDFLWGRVWFGLRLRIRLRFTIWLSFPVRISFWYRYSEKSSVLSSQKNWKDRLLWKRYPLRNNSNFPLKEIQITKKKNISNAPFSKAKSENEKQIKNEPELTSSKEPNLNQPPEFDYYLFDLTGEILWVCSFRRNFWKNSCKVHF